MPASRQFTLSKAERISSKRQVDRLFRGGGSRAMSAFPLRMVYTTQERSDDCREPHVQMMVSVPKRCFKRAVKRNRVKRQVREAYRRNKHILADALAERADITVLVAFIFTHDELHASAEIESKVKNLLTRLGEKLGGKQCTPQEES